MVPRLVPFQRGGKWGFCNPDRELVIACEYDAVDRFRPLEGESLALARVGLGSLPQERRYGMVNLAGEIVIPLDYADLEPFSCGLAKARRYGKSLYGFIDSQGKPLTPHEFESAQSFSEGLAYVTYPTRKRVQEHGFVHRQGQMCLSGRLLFDDAQPFQQGFSVVTHYAARGYFYSYLKPDGSFLTVHKTGRACGNLNWFCSASPFQDERALVYGELTGYAIIDPTGLMVADLGFEFDAAYPASQGWIRVIKGGDTGYLDTQGNEVIPCILDYARVRDFCCGLAAFQETPDGPWGFLGTQLETLIPPKYQEVADFCEGLATVKCGDAYACVNTRGHEVVPPRYSYLGSFEDGLALASRDGMKFYIDIQGVEYQGDGGLPGSGGRTCGGADPQTEPGPVVDPGGPPVPP